MKFRILWTRKPRGLTVFETKIRAKSVADAREKFARSEEGKTANLEKLNIQFTKRPKPRKRKVEKIGVSLLRGGLGKKNEIKFRGKEYTLFRQGFYEDALKIGRDLKKDGYDVRFTKGTFDGSVLNIYVRPALPYAPSHRYSFGKRVSPISSKSPRITPKRPRLER